MYFLNCQAALWRRKDLISFLSPYEDAWQFEVYGTCRAKLFSKKFLIQSTDNKVFNYDFSLNSGFGIFRGKWLKSNVKLFADNDIEINFSRLGFYEGNGAYPQTEPPRKCVKDRWLYFMYGGSEDTVRMPILEQIKLFLRHPRAFLHMVKNKIIYIFTNKRVES